MKVNGKLINGPRTHTVVLPYGDSQEDFIAFKFRALTVKDDFEKIMPRPKPPRLQKPGGQEFHDFEDAGFKRTMDAWATNKVNWEFLQSISATDDLEWSTVKADDPNTWGNWKTEIEETFGLVDFNRIFNGFLEANSLDEGKLDEARARFLASQEAKA